MATIKMPEPGERRKDLPTITIGPRLRRELSARLLELASWRSIRRFVIRELKHSAARHIRMANKRIRQAEWME